MADAGSMTVDTAAVTRQEVVDYITVVGNLIGEATVDVVPRVGGPHRRDPGEARRSRDQGPAGRQDRRSRNPRADQPGAGHARSEQGQRHAARKRCAGRSRTRWTGRRRRYERGLTAQADCSKTPRRATTRPPSQVNVAKAQQSQTQVAHRRAEDHALEHQHPLPGRRLRQPAQSRSGRVRRRQHGAPARSSTSAPCGSSPISSRRISAGRRPASRPRSRSTRSPARTSRGEVSRVAPVFDPATRTAQMEIEVPNPGLPAEARHVRARAADGRAAAERADRAAQRRRRPRRQARRVPRRQGQTAQFREVRTGLQDGERVEILDGLDEGQRVITDRRAGAARRRSRRARRARRPGRRAAAAGQRDRRLAAWALVGRTRPSADKPAPDRLDD